MAKQLAGRDSHPGRQGGGQIRAEVGDLALIHELASQGKSLKIIASKLGISNSLLDTWLGNTEASIDRKDERVRAAWEDGLAIYEDNLTGVLHRAVNKDDHRMQIPAAMFLLKVKCKWRERDGPVVVEVTQKKSGSKFKVKDISPPDND